MSSHFAAKHKSDKGYHPTKGSLTTKWERAAKDAEETKGLTRQERLDQFLVSYKLEAQQNSAGKVKKAQSSKKSTPVSKGSAAANNKRTSAGRPAIKSSLDLTPSDEEEEPLPPDWRVSLKFDGGRQVQVFVSPDNTEFQVLKFSGTADQ